MNEKLKEIIDMIPLIKEIGGKETAYCIWNEEAVAEAFIPSNVVTKGFPVGFKVPDSNDPIYETLRTGKITYNKIPAQAFGIALEGKIIPIYDGSKIVGAFTCVFATEVKDEITNNIDNLTTSLERTNHSIKEIADGAESLSINMNNVQGIAAKVDEKLEEVELEYK